MNCESCGGDTLSLTIFKVEGTPKLICKPCLAQEKGATVQAHFVIGDDIPGGVDIKHGVCHEDGTPRKYYSKSSIREAAYNAGYFQGDDTPKVHPKIAEQRAANRERSR